MWIPRVASTIALLVALGVAVYRGAPVALSRDALLLVAFFVTVDLVSLWWRRPWGLSR